MNYLDELTRAMTWLGEKESTTFLGQAVGCPGTAMHGTFRGVPPDKLHELPVFEETQMGLTLGLSLEGLFPISVFPRWNFLLCACSALVNHVDKLPLISSWRPRLIVRTASGSESPLDPGPQHKGDFTDAFRLMLQTMRVVRLTDADLVFDAYRRAYEYESAGATILVEDGNLYGK